MYLKQIIRNFLGKSIGFVNERKALILYNASTILLQFFLKERLTSAIRILVR